MILRGQRWKWCDRLAIVCCCCVCQFHLNKQMIRYTLINRSRWAKKNTDHIIISVHVSLRHLNFFVFFLSFVRFEWKIRSNPKVSELFWNVFINENTNSEEIKWDFWNTYAISWPFVMCECNGILSFHIPSSCWSFFFVRFWMILCSFSFTHARTHHKLWLFTKRNSKWFIFVVYRYTTARSFLYSIQSTKRRKSKRFTNGSWHHTKVSNLTLLTTTTTTIADEERKNRRRNDARAMWQRCFFSPNNIYHERFLMCSKRQMVKQFRLVELN